QDGPGSIRVLEWRRSPGGELLEEAGAGSPPGETEGRKGGGLQHHYSRRCRGPHGFGPGLDQDGPGIRLHEILDVSHAEDRLSLPWGRVGMFAEHRGEFTLLDDDTETPRRRPKP